MQKNEANKPAINIYYSSKVDKIEEKIRALLNGIEEEGIPYRLINENTQDILSLSYEACVSSILGVGLGVNNDEIVLHYEKLDKLKPLFCIDAKSSYSIIRALGSNAARLVKRMPFKEMKSI